MARYGPKHKQHTREKVLQEAGRALRTEGPSEVTIPGIMSRVGLTQGAFYAHFASKEALVAEASAEAIAMANKRLLARGRSAPRGSEMVAIVEHYLSQTHRDNLTDGCPLPSFSADALRGPASTRKAYTETLQELFDGYAELLPESADKSLPDLELGLAATMVGGLLLSRAVDDPDLSDRILAAARALCLRTLGRNGE